MGGNGKFSKQQEKLLNSDVSIFRIELSPNIGYFIIDKLSGGVKPRLDFIQIKTNDVVRQTTTLGGGPFLRYYLFPSDKTTNLILEATYQYSSSNNGFSQSIVTFSGGPVIYLNSSVGLEFILNYEIANISGLTTNSKNFFLGIGFQIHLEKE
jgi:hypothetical protein